MEEAFDSMQTQISLTMEKVQNRRHVSFDQQMRNSLTHSTHKCQSMLEILQRHKKHLDHRLGYFRDKQEEMDKTMRSREVMMWPILYSIVIKQ